MATQAGALLGIEAVGEAVQESRRVQVSGPGGVHHGVDRLGRRASTGPWAVTTTEPAAPRVMTANRPVSAKADNESSRELAGEKKPRLVLVGEQDVDVVAHEFEELPLVAFDAEGVRQAQRNQGV